MHFQKSIKKGTRVSSDTIYLNHLISYVKNGILEGLTNAKLRELGQNLEFCPGLPELFPLLQAITKESEAYKKHNIQLEHYIISTGLAEMIEAAKLRTTSPIFLVVNSLKLRCHLIFQSKKSL